MSPRPIAAEVGWPRWVERCGENNRSWARRVCSVWGVEDAVIEGYSGVFRFRGLMMEGKGERLDRLVDGVCGGAGDGIHKKDRWKEEGVCIEVLHITNLLKFTMELSLS
jgi:hypothetical protein